MSGEKWIKARDKEHPRWVQQDLDGFLQAETEAKQSAIDYETYLRHKKNIALRWFKYYKMNKNPQKKLRLIDQYNRIALMKGRE